MITDDQAAKLERQLFADCINAPMTPRRVTNRSSPHSPTPITDFKAYQAAWYKKNALRIKLGLPAKGQKV